ncbi:MAG: glycoside hydrolase family 16 protein [Clostridia bacterium]|nr:glycoside hydrolase family 16 protein [Clostridia bacterium]
MNFLKSVFAFILSLILTASSSAFPAIPHEEDFVLQWSDEFEGDSVDLTKWTCNYNGEENVLRKGGIWNPDFATVKDGNLHIRTEYFPQDYNGNGIPGWYTARLNSIDRFTQRYGYFEVRCILPKGKGLWSAFWMMSHGVGNVDGGGVDGAEIDIFESAFYDSPSIFKNRVSSNIHYDGYGEAHRQKNICKPFIFINNPYEEYNTYGLEWNENEYIFYINGIETGRSDFGGVSQDEEWLILSVEVGGENGVPGESWVGASIETNTEPPTDFIVDYVRVYQYKDLVD